MRITGTQTTTQAVSIDVRPVDLWKVLRQAIMRKYGLQAAEYLREQNGKAVFKADDEHRHGSITESVVIADPTETQIAVWNAVWQLETLADFRTLENQQWPS